MELVKIYSDALKSKYDYINKLDALKFLKAKFGTIIGKYAIIAYNETYNY